MLESSLCAAPVDSAPYNYKILFRRSNCIYVELPKCASSTLKTLFLSLELGLDARACRSLLNPTRRASELPTSSVDAAAYLGGAYLRFTFIRNPWARIASSYFNVAWVHSIQSQDITFERFVGGLERRLATPPNDVFNNHFKPVTYFVPQDSQGKLQIDFVGKVETLEKDLASLADELGLVFPTPIPRLNKSVEHDYRSLYSAATASRIAQLFPVDIELGQYRF